MRESPPSARSALDFRLLAFNLSEDSPVKCAFPAVPFPRLNTPPGLALVAVAAILSVLPVASQGQKHDAKHAEKVATAAPRTPVKTPIQIVADLSEAPRKLYHAEIDLPVTEGPLTLITPEWIPGNHRPTGPAEDLTGVVFSIDGKAIPWRRDDENLYEFHVTIPKGVATLHAHLDCIVTARVSQKMAVLEWEKLLLYPANIPVKDIPIQPSLKVPAGWGV